MNARVGNKKIKNLIAIYVENVKYCETLTDLCEQVMKLKISNLYLNETVVRIFFLSSILVSKRYNIKMLILTGYESKPRS